MDKKYLNYYPNLIAKLNQFSKYYIDSNRLNDYCNGKYEYHQDDDGSYGYSRRTKNLTESERLERSYLWNEFDLWKTWYKAGKNIFDFSEGLLEMLKDTDVAEMDLQHIKLPYPVIYLDISKAEIPFRNESPLIEGVYITDNYNDDIDEISTFERTINFDFTGEYIENFKEINNSLYSHVRGFHSYTLYLDKPYNITKVGESVINAKDIFVKVHTWDDQDENIKIDLYKTHSLFIERTVKIVINCLLYLTLKDKDIIEKFTKDLPTHLKNRLNTATTKRKKEVVIGEIINNGYTKIKYIGTTICRPKEKYDSINGTVSTHWRRGHWRSQKYGEHLSLSKFIWIAPTIVNKEKGEPQKGHVYTADMSSKS